MELDDFKLKSKKGSFIKDTSMKDVQTDIDNVITSFKAAMSAQRKKRMLFIGLLIIMSALYLSAGTFQTGFARLGYELLVSGFIAGAIFLKFRYKPIPGSAYFLPMADFLSFAEKRLVYFARIDWIVIIPLLLILGTGGGMIFVSSLLKYTDNQKLLTVIWILLYLFICVFGFFAGRKDWKKEHGELLNTLSDYKRTLIEN